MLTEIYISALLVDEDLAAQVWNAGLISDDLAAKAWWLMAFTRSGQKSEVESCLWWA